MYFKQIMNEDCGCSSYIVASRASRECAVVDPELDVQPYLHVMAERGMTLRYIIDTHLHADHVSGARRLSGETGGLSFFGNDLRAAVERVWKHQDGYYLIGYEPAAGSLPAPGADSVEHQITVRVARKGLTVRARRVY